MKTYLVSKESFATFGQTAAGAHCVFHAAPTHNNPIPSLSGVVEEIVASNPSANFRLAVEGTVVCEDMRLDTAKMVEALKDGKRITVGHGSNVWLTVRLVEAWPTRENGRGGIEWVPAEERFPPQQSVEYDAINKAYQRSVLR